MVSNAQSAVGSSSGAVMVVLLRGGEVGCRRHGRYRARGIHERRHMMSLRVSLSLGARGADPRLPCSQNQLLNLVNHPGHPTAVGGLPASEPGLDAGTHDRYEA
ncbi:hypothetical protein GCM10023114_20150 [Mycolicibacterium sediminis]